MLFAPVNGGLEVRGEPDGGATIAGRFPFGAEAELQRGRFETFQPGAFEYEDVHLLASHDFAKPLASRGAGSLSVNDTDDALQFEARISPEVANTSHGRDTLALARAGLSVGLSPGFAVAPDGETVSRRDNGVLRTVRSAKLHELSVVTRPAYDAAQVEARSWDPAVDLDAFINHPMVLPAFRWR
ncbi:HK97 family phage prohead protease [Salinisphaera sp. USBA-960]|nr:HK97 family phage prohead protease [Salifodinibacter halophilus]NNC27268.1 HK97 family phage prohead protease [Salifodinibacter halophilus]